MGLSVHLGLRDAIMKKSSCLPFPRYFQSCHVLLRFCHDIVGLLLMSQISLSVIIDRALVI